MVRRKHARAHRGSLALGVRTMGHSSCAFLYFAAFLVALLYSKNLDGGSQGSSPEASPTPAPRSVSGAERALQGTNSNPRKPHMVGPGTPPMTRTKRIPVKCSEHMLNRYIDSGTQSGLRASAPRNPKDERHQGGREG